VHNKKKKNFYRKPHYRRQSEEEKKQHKEEIETKSSNENHLFSSPEITLKDASNENLNYEIMNVTKTEESDLVQKEATIKEISCSICKLPIKNYYTAIRHGNGDEMVHFDCALRELSREHGSKLGRFKKIYYIGAGNFAIVKEFYDRYGHLKNYEIIEKISYEKRENHKGQGS